MKASKFLATTLLAFVGVMASIACDDDARGRAPAAVSALKPATKAALALDAGSPADAAPEDAASGLADLQAWRERLPMEISDPACVPQLKALAQSDPALLLAVAQARRKNLGNYAVACTYQQHVVEALRSVDSSEPLLRILRDPAGWRFGAQPAWGDAARVIVEHSDQLLPKASAEDLISLLSAPRFADDALLSGLLVAVRKDSPRRRDLYRDWAPKFERPDPRFAREYLREFPLALMPWVWLEQEDDSCGQDLARAVFESVRPADTTELSRMLETRAAHWRARPVAFGFLIAAVVRLGAPKGALACRKELPRSRCLMVSVETGERTSAAVATCLTAARAWLRTRVP